MIVPSSIIFFILITSVERDSLTVVKSLMYLPHIREPCGGWPAHFPDNYDTQGLQPKCYPTQNEWTFSLLCSLDHSSTFKAEQAWGSENCVTVTMLWLSHSNKKSRFLSFEMRTMTSSINWYWIVHVIALCTIGYFTKPMKNGFFLDEAIICP